MIMRKMMIISLAAVLVLSYCGITSAYINVNLPSGPVTLNAHSGTQSYFNTELKNVPSGNDIHNGMFIDWCGDIHKFITLNHDYTNTYLYSIYNSSMPSYLWHSNLSKVNYILNHKAQNANWWQVQYAIWYLLDYGNSGLNSDGWSMVENASIYGEDYSPTYFDIIGIMADPGQCIQRQILELRPVDPNGDADGDSITNLNEDLNSDGNPYNDDTDLDGISNFLDPDDDGDNISTLTEITDGNEFGQDVDGDGIPNYLDTDSDGDGLSDLVEGTGDRDGDEIPNYLDFDDIIPPSKVENLIAEDAKDGKINLSWDPATDNVGVDHYEVYRNSVFQLNVTGTFWQDTGLHNGDCYNYTVRAVDAAGNKGEFADPAYGVPTETDTQAPSKVENLVAEDAKDGKIDLSWDPSTDNVGVDHYEIYRDGIFLVNVTITSYQDSGLTNGQSYTYTVRAVDAAGNIGEFSDPASGMSTETDTQAPSKVTGLTVTDAYDGKLDLSWDPATDNVGVDHYEIYRDGVFLVNVTSTSYQDSDLTNGQLYNYTVRAVDAAGNIGEFSDPASGMSTETDTQAPSKVENLTAKDAKDGKIDLSWDPATDNFGVDHYEIYRDGVLIFNTSGTSYRDSGLNDGQSYTYKVRAVDAAGNIGEFSDPATATPTKTQSNNQSQNDNNNNNNDNQNRAPVADASAGEPYTGLVDEEITFDGSNSYDPDHDSLSYHWDFGDGSSGTGKIVTHIYTQAGEYKVILKVTDSKGAYDTDETIAAVTESNHLPSTPDVTGPTEGLINIEYEFSVVSTDDDNDAIKYTINWGDGTNNESDFLASGLAFIIKHKWAQTGNYTIKVTADDNKTISTIDVTIIINEPKPKVIEENNIWLIFLALLGLLLLLLFLLLAKRKKDDDEEENKKNKRNKK